MGSQVAETPHRIVLMDAKPAPRLGDGGEPLELRNINAQAFGEITHHCQSQSLRLYHLTVVSLEGIEALRTVTELSLEWATKVVSLAPVFRMGWLRRLTVVDLPRLVDLEGIEALATLTGLRAGGGMWKAMRLPSARPLAGLRSLEHLELEQIRFADDDIRVLAELTRLRYLRLSNQFERAQVAFLAKAQRGVRSGTFRRATERGARPRGRGRSRALAGARGRSRASA